MDVLQHLVDEHRQVESLLDELSDSEPGRERDEALRRLEASLGTHMAVEDRFVYPIVREVVGDEDEKEAEIEHGLTRDGLAKLRELAAEPGFGAAVATVKAGVGHHVDEEEHEVFPALRDKAAVRLAELGEAKDLDEAVRSAAGGTTKEGLYERKEGLYERAKEAGAPGRSTMTKAELEAVPDGWARPRRTPREAPDHPPRLEAARPGTGECA